MVIREIHRALVYDPHGLSGKLTFALRWQLFHRCATTTQSTHGSGFYTFVSGVVTDTICLGWVKFRKNVSTSHIALFLSFQKWML